MDFGDFYWLGWLAAFLALELPAAIWRRDWTLSVHVWQWFDIGVAWRALKQWGRYSLEVYRHGGEVVPGEILPAPIPFRSLVRWLVLGGLLGSVVLHFLAVTSAVPIMVAGAAAALVIGHHYTSRRARAGGALLAALALLLAGCGGNPPPIDVDLDLVVCLATCEGSCERVENVWTCKPPPLPSPQCATDPTSCDCWREREWVACEPTPPEPQCSDAGSCDCWNGFDWKGCSPNPPEPQCSSSSSCDCYSGDDWRECEPAPACKFNPPTLRELRNAGKRVRFSVGRLSKMIPDATPQGEFGRDYYCQPGLWPEACREGRSFGPVVPPGHPLEAVCVAAVLEQPCPTWRSRCTGTLPHECPITFDPYFVIGGTNQNHPKNVAAGCPESSWEKAHGTYGAVLSGQWWIATAHGKGHIVACTAPQEEGAPGGPEVCGESDYVIEN